MKHADKDNFENVRSRETNFHELISQMFMRDRFKCPIQAAVHECHQCICSIEWCRQKGLHGQKLYVTFLNTIPTMETNPVGLK